MKSSKKSIKKSTRWLAVGLALALAVVLLVMTGASSALASGGPGYPAAVLEKPFEPYVTFKQGGSGLGLAICRKIVSDHDGRISLSNPADGGASTIVNLPLG